MAMKLEEETGKYLRDPQDTMARLLIKLDMDEEKEARESGTVQNDSDLNQALRQWRDHEQFLKQQEEDASKSQEQQDKEANEAKIHRQNLLLGLRNKRKIQESDDDTQSESDTPAQTNSKQMLIQRRKSSGCRRRGVE